MSRMATFFACMGCYISACLLAVPFWLINGKWSEAYEMAYHLPACFLIAILLAIRGPDAFSNVVEVGSRDGCSS